MYHLPEIGFETTLVVNCGITMPGDIKGDAIEGAAICGIATPGGAIATGYRNSIIQYSTVLQTKTGFHMLFYSP